MTILFSLVSMLFSFLAMISYSDELKLVLFGMSLASFCTAVAFFSSSFIQKDTVTQIYPEKKIPLRDASGKFIKRK